MTPQTLSRFLEWLEGEIEDVKYNLRSEENIQQYYYQDGVLWGLEKAYHYFMGRTDNLTQDAINADKDEPYA